MTCASHEHPPLYGRKKCLPENLQGGCPFDIRLPVSRKPAACIAILPSCLMIYPVMTRLTNILQILVIERYLRITYIVSCKCNSMMYYLSDITATYLA